MKSKCCNSELKAITSDEGTSYYECTSCNKPSDPMTPSQEAVERIRIGLLEKLQSEFAPGPGVSLSVGKAIDEVVDGIISQELQKAEDEEKQKLTSEVLYIENVVKKLKAPGKTKDKISWESGKLRAVHLICNYLYESLNKGTK